MARRAIAKTAPQASLAEVLDRVLDRGIVIDAWVRVSLVGITLIDVDARVVVASIKTYVRESDAMAHTMPAARPAVLRAPAPDVPRRPAPARREPRPPRTLQCGYGCTFTRRAGRQPAKVRCPSDPQQRCPVTVLAPAA